jgi:hypothetical protein
MQSEAVAAAHTQMIAHIRSLADLISPDQVAYAFAASLSSRQLEMRSALGSYAVARVMPDHPLETVAGTYATICKICGWSRMPDGREEPIENLARERRRFGGVRHQDPTYIQFDLQEFLEGGPSTPTDDDWTRLRKILRTPVLLAPSAKAADLERALKDVVRSNKSERTVLIQILAIAGILEAEGHPSFFDEFVAAPERDLPPQRFADWGYPTIWWRAHHGIRSDAVAFWFPDVS